MVILGILGSFSLTYVLMPPVIAFCHRAGILDVPTDLRRMHTEAIPRAGGVAILPSVLLFCLVFGYGGEVLPLLAGAVLVLLVGLADDAFCLSAPIKLLFECAAAFAAVLGSGYTGSRAIWAVLWLVLLTNAHNLVDGMDGLFCGCALIESVLLCGALFFAGAVGTEVLLLLGGALLAFRCFNRHPAAVFAGDGGALSVGFLLGALSLPLLFEASSPFSALSPVFLFAYPLTELGTSVLRRLLHARSPFRADRAHLHHRLYAAGLSVPECTSLLLSVGASLGGVGVLLSSEPLWGYAVIALILSVAVLLRVRAYMMRVI